LISLQLSPRDRKIGFLCFLGAAVLYGSFGLLIRTLDRDFSAVQQIALRSAGSLLIVICWIALSSPKQDFSALRQWKVWGFGLTFPISVFIWTISVVIGNVRSATFGLYFGSLIASAFLGWKLYSEKLTRYNVLSIGLALLATLVFTLPFSSSSSVLPSLFWSAVAGTIQSLNMCYRRWLKNVSRQIVILVQSMGGFIICSTIAFAVSKEMPVFSGTSLLIGLLFGSLVVLVSYLLLVGSNNLELNKGSVILSTEIIWATLLAAVFLSEIPTPSQLLGCLLLLGALFLQNRGEVAVNTEIESSPPH
jgi:drug/metabolite transporter (DMT)-like permease